jgi:hypothetical protein
MRGSERSRKLGVARRGCDQAADVWIARVEAELGEKGRGVLGDCFVLASMPISFSAS